MKFNEVNLMSDISRFFNTILCMITGSHQSLFIQSDNSLLD